MKKDQIANLESYIAGLLTTYLQGLADASYPDKINQAVKEYIALTNINKGELIKELLK